MHALLLHMWKQDIPEKAALAYTRAKMAMPNAVAIVSTRLEFRKQSTGVTEAPPESPVVLLEMSDLQRLLLENEAPHRMCC